MYIKLYNYDKDSNKKDTKIFSLFSFFSITYLPAFVQLTYNSNDISCKFFMGLLAYHVYAKKW